MSRRIFFSGGQNVDAMPVFARATTRQAAAHRLTASDGNFLRAGAEIEDQFHVLKAMQEAGMHDVHEVGEIQGAVGTFGPAAIATEKLARSRITHQSFHGFSESHAQKCPFFWANFKWGEDLKFRFLSFAFCASSRFVAGRFATIQGGGALLGFAHYGTRRHFAGGGGKDGKDRAGGRE